MAHKNDAQRAVHRGLGIVEAMGVLNQLDDGGVPITGWADRVGDRRVGVSTGRPPQARDIFKHALIQDAAYASLLRGTRQQFHEQIARLMESRIAQRVNTQPDLMAHHDTEAGCDEAAAEYGQRAGDLAGRRSAYAEAIAHPCDTSETRSFDPPWIRVIRGRRASNQNNIAVHGVTVGRL